MVHIKIQYFMFDGLFLQQQSKMKSRRGATGGGGGMKVSRKMDRKSGRGVMFENDGLRMRNIDMSAEVEKGQSDLRKLKKENETLKQQVWTLRDEYDKLETLVKGMESSESDDDDDDDDSTERSCTDLSCRRRNSTLSKETMDGVDLLDDAENVEKIYSNATHYSLQPHATIDGIPCSAQTVPSIIPPCTRLTAPDQYMNPPEHFNLDQLLDFASSFHYDRRKHLTSDEPATVSAVTLPSGDCPPQPFLFPDKAAAGLSGFASARRRSATVIEQVSEGSSGTAVIEEMKSVSNEEGATGITAALTPKPDVSIQTTSVTYTRSSSIYLSSSLDGSRSQSLGAGLNSASCHRGGPTSFYAPGSSSNLKGGASSLDAGLPLVSIFPQRTPLVRLSSIEPNTLMVSVAEMPQLWDITTQEIIDELEQQVGPSLPDIHGVRVAGRAAYISLGRREPLQSLLTQGLTVRGHSVPLIDVTRESVVVGLTGVPHYIADGTLFILLAAFGIIIGEIERRFYKGVDTGERYVRMKLKKLVKLPKYVTVGGCRIVLTVHDRIGSLLPEWAHLPPPSTHVTRPPPPPQASFTSQEDKAHCSQPSTSMEKIIDATQLRKDFSFPSTSELKPPKTFSTRCVVNLKVPERPTSTGAIPRPIHREAPPPPPPTIITQSPLSPGHVLRVGSLDRNQRIITSVSLPVNSTDASLLAPHPHSQQSALTQNISLQPQIQIQRPSANPLNSQARPTLQASSASSQQPPPPDCTRPARPTSVAFDDTPREGNPRNQPPSSTRPPPLANGILRRASMSQEQEALLPQRQTTTATIRSRLRIGGHKPPPIRSRGQTGGRQLGRMESISENTISEDVSDVTPLGSRSRRDSERSSVSGTSRASANKARKDVIDLPWCGCWGNGCI